MDKVTPEKRHRCRATVLNIISSLCSVASIAFCVLLSINAADLQNRVVGLESGNGEHPIVRAPGYSMGDFNSLIQQRVDELLSQVTNGASLHTCSQLLNATSRLIDSEVTQLESGSTQNFTMDDFNRHVHANESCVYLKFQRSYENYVKIRTARQASPECNCPPGKGIHSPECNLGSACLCACGSGRFETCLLT